MNHLRLHTKLGLIVGILVLCVVAVALVGYRELGAVSRRTEQMVETTSKKVYLTVTIRANLQRARRMEFRAVITPDDKESQEYADRDSRNRQEVDGTIGELDKLIDQNARPPNGRPWRNPTGLAGVRQVQEQTLKLAVENSNVKAHTLATGKVAEKISAINQAAVAALRQVEKQQAEVQAANDPKRVEAAEKDRRALGRLQVIALDMHRQLNQHVFDTTDEEMDRLDEQIAAWLKEADERLAELSASAGRLSPGRRP